jgi:hypothetical protein
MVSANFVYEDIAGVRHTLSARDAKFLGEREQFFVVEPPGVYRAKRYVEWQGFDRSDVSTIPDAPPIDYAC